VGISAGKNKEKRHAFHKLAFSQLPSDSHVVMPRFPENRRTKSKGHLPWRAVADGARQEQERRPKADGPAGAMSRTPGQTRGCGKTWLRFFDNHDKYGCCEFNGAEYKQVQHWL